MLGRTVLLLRFTSLFLGVTRSWIDSLSYMNCTTVDFVRSLIGPFVTAAHPFPAQHLWYYVSLIQTSTGHIARIRRQKGHWPSYYMQMEDLSTSEADAIFRRMFHCGVLAEFPERLCQN
jgi:hypothetical protein